MEGMSLWRTGKENSDKKERSKISDTTARGVIGMMAVIFIFQAVTFTIHKCSDKDTGDSPVSGYPAQAAHIQPEVSPIQMPSKPQRQESAIRFSGLTRIQFPKIAFRCWDSLINKLLR